MFQVLKKGKYRFIANLTSYKAANPAIKYKSEYKSI